MVRALGARDAVVVGHDWGGVLAWTVATLHPGLVSRLAVLSMPHPLRLREAVADATAAQLRALSPVALLPAAARPGGAAAPGRRGVRRRAPARLGRPGLPRRRDRGPLPRGGAGAGRRALLDGVVPLGGPVADPPQRLALPAPARARRRRADAAGARRPRPLPARPHRARLRRWVDAPYELQVLDGVGHFPHEEAADARLRRAAGPRARACRREARARARRRRPAGAARLAGGGRAGARGGAAAVRGPRPGPRPARAGPAVLRPRRARGRAGRPRRRPSGCCGRASRRSASG